ncbi:hypothetical protein [Mycolicibacterium pyrenivorans]|nr:hypothetical protein [Mycolicibacterium pyrenivorans]
MFAAIRRDHRVEGLSIRALADKQITSREVVDFGFGVVHAA